MLADVPQGLILGPLFLLVYVNDLLDKLESLVQLFDDDISLFSIVSDSSKSDKLLNDDLKKLPAWTFRLKMLGRS